jgi:macrolide-specific efflux system membrane fusion protein
MNKRIVWIIAGLVFILALLSMVKILGMKKQMPPNATIVTPAYGSIKTWISTTGVVKPQNRLEIKPPINGRVEKILVKEGDKVTTGQLLALISSTERTALLDTALLQDTGTVKYWQGVYNTTPLLAPIDGVVIVKAVEPGQTVVDRDIILVLSDRLIVQAEVDETDIGKVKTGHSAVISLDAYPDMKINGKVDHVYYEAKLVRNVTIYGVDILPETIPANFRSGMSANIEIIQNSKDNILLVPNEAVQEDTKGKYVLIDAGGKQKPTRKDVEIGISDDENSEVISGVTIDDHIVVIKAKEKYTSSDNTKTGKVPFMPSGGS